MAKAGATYEQLETAFRHRNFKPLYFLYGEEPWFANQLQEVFLANVLSEHERAFNQDIVYGTDTETQAVMALCASYPMMAERRAIVVREFDSMKNNRLFASYAASPNPQASVLLICQGKPNASAHPYRALRDHAVWAEFKTLYSNQLPGWVQKYVQASGRTIDAQAAGMLADLVGNNLSSAATEVEKLITFVGGRQALTVQDIVQATGQTREFNVFELQKAIGEGRRAEAVRIAERMLRHSAYRRSEAIMIVSVLSGYFTRLWKLGAGKAAGVPESSLAGRVGVSPYFLKEYVSALKRMGMPFVEEAFKALLAADFELKGGAERDERLVLTLLLGKLVPEAKTEDKKSRRSASDIVY